MDKKILLTITSLLVTLVIIPSIQDFITGTALVGIFRLHDYHTILERQIYTRNAEIMLIKHNSLKKAISLLSQDGKDKIKIPLHVGGIICLFVDGQFKNGTLTYGDHRIVHNSLAIMTPIDQISSVLFGLTFGILIFYVLNCMKDTDI